MAGGTDQQASRQHVAVMVNESDSDRPGSAPPTAILRQFLELAITVSLGLIGWALTDWLGLQGGAAFVLAAMLGRSDPDRLEPLFDSFQAQLVRKLRAFALTRTITTYLTSSMNC
jgi:hypothetical protein